MLKVIFIRKKLIMVLTIQYGRYAIYSVPASVLIVLINTI